MVRSKFRSGFAHSLLGPRQNPPNIQTLIKYVISGFRAASLSGYVPYQRIPIKPLKIRKFVAFLNRGARQMVNPTRDMIQIRDATAECEDGTTAV